MNSNVRSLQGFFIVNLEEALNFCKPFRFYERLPSLFFCIRDSVKAPDFTTPSRKLTTQEIEQYWTQWKNLFPPEKDRFWNDLLTGLNNYLTILQGKKKEVLYSLVCMFVRDNSRMAEPILIRFSVKYLLHVGGLVY